MKKYSFLILMLAGMAVRAQENYSLWSYYKTITINTTAANGGANVLSGRNNYPLLVRLSGAAHAAVFTYAAANGSDLRFTKPDGVTRLPHQIERWSPGTQTAEIWVRMDVVAGNGLTDLRMYWGRTGAPDSSSGAQVYNVPDGNVGVWHMGEASGNRLNAVPGGNPAVPTNYTGVFRAGYIAGADSLRGGAAGATSDYLHIGGGYANFTGGFTYYAWVYPTSNANYARFFEAANGTNRGDNISIYRANTSNNLIFELTNGTTALGTISAVGVIAQNTWQHIAAVYTPGTPNTITLYRNGVQVATGNVSAALANVNRANGYLGRSNYTADASYAGKYDEVNITNYATNADRIKLHYETQRQGATCVTIAATVAQVAPTALVYSSNPVTYGVGVAIAANNPTVTGVASSFSVAPALPAGLTLNLTTGIITGTPTVATGAADYIVTATNAAGSITRAVNIRVLAAPTGLTYTLTPATYGIGAAIAPNNPTVTGTVTGYTVNPALPAGLTINAGTGVITGTPTTASVATNYTVTASNVAGNTTAILNFRVLAAPTGLTYSTNPATYGVNVAIPPNNPTVTGTIISWSVNPALPAGINFNTATGIISGMPTAASVATNYIVTATNPAGSTTATVNIRVLTAPTGLTYSQTPAIYPVNVVITPNTPTVTGTVTGYAINPALPAGLAISATTGIISGTPTAGSAAQNYTVTAQNVAGSTTAILNLSVLGAPSGLTYSQSPAIYGVNVAITANNPTVIGTVTGYAVAPALPAGLTISTTTGVITGTPTAASAGAIFIITASNSVGQTTANLNITVLSAPIGLSYSTNPAIYRVGTAITANSPTVTGTISGYSITPALPAGLTLSATTGIITGNPTAARAAQNYTVTATNVAGSIQVVLNIAALDPPTNLRYATDPAAYGINLAITPNAPTVTGTVTRYTVSPVLPPGLALDSITGVVSGTPTVASALTPYTVTASNPVGSTTVALDITIIATSSNFSYSQNPAIYRVGVAITPNTPTVVGTVDSFLVSPALPAGLALNKTTGIITGTPTAVTASTNYQVTAINLAGNTLVLLNIAVVTAPTGLSYSQNPAVYGMNTAITANTPTVTGFISNYTIAPALPAGLVINATTGTISGTPTVAATAANYVVTGSNVAGSVLDTLNITVLTLPSNLTFLSPVTYGVGVAITPNTPTVTGTVQGYSISPALPAGLALNPITGIISGTATASSPATNYTVTAVNAAGSTTATVNVRVLSAPATLSYLQNPAVYGLGAAITPNTPTVTGGAVQSYSVSPALPAGLALNSGTGIISGTPTAAIASTTFTVTASNIAGAIPVTLTISVLAIPNSLRYSANPAVYAVNAAITANNPTLNGTASSYSVTPALPAGLALNTGTGIITGTPTIAAAAANYTVTAANAAGSTTVILTLAELSPPAGLSYTEDTVIYTVGSPITQNNPTITGTVTGYTVSPALPAGLTLNPATGVITGTPTAAAAAANYTITASNSAGSTPFILRITVLSVPTGLVYSRNPASYGVGTAITPNVPTVNGVVTSYSVNPSLPAGLVLDALTGIITGTPSTETTAAIYTVSATNSSGSATFSLNIAILSSPSNFSYDQNPALYGVGVAIAPNVPTVMGSVTGFTVTPALPAGLTLNPSTGIISGTPTTETAAGYLITAQNTVGSVTVNLTLTVLAATTNFSYSDTSAIYTLGMPITQNNPVIQGTPLGYFVSPALPAGLNLNSATGVISGTPTVPASRLQYTVTAQNASGTVTTTTFFVEVRALNSNFFYAQNTVVYAVNVAITPNAPTVTGTVSSYSVSPNLPNGLTLNTTTGVISGTPTVVAPAQNYDVTGTNVSGSSVITLNFAVVAAPATLTYPVTTAVYALNAPITAISPTVTGTVASYAVNSPLPQGLALNTATGIISGTPIAAALAQNYIITATNVAGSTSFTVNIEILAPPTAFTYSQIQVTYNVGTPITPNTPTITGSALTYAVDVALPPGLSLDPATGIISGTPSALSTAVTYNFTATNISGTAQTSIIINVDTAIFIAVRPGRGKNEFSLKFHGAYLAHVGLPKNVRWAKVEMVNMLGKSFGVRTHDLQRGVEMEWNPASALPNGLLLIKISLLDGNRKTISASLMKVPHIQ